MLEAFISEYVLQSKFLAGSLTGVRFKTGVGKTGHSDLIGRTLLDAKFYKVHPKVFK
jgi:hypothetical protein